MSATASLAPRAQVLINHKPFQLMHWLESITVSETLDAISMFTLKFAELSLTTAHQVWLSPENFLTFDIGTQVQIQMGFGNALEPLIIGEITALEPDFTDQTANLTVRGHDLRHRLSRGSKNRVFSNKTDSDIAQAIALEHNLMTKIEQTTTQLDYVRQTWQTDLAFLQSRVNQIGYEMGMDLQTFYFRPRQFKKPKQFTLDLVRDHLTLSLRISTMNQVGAVEVPGWDATQNQPFIGRASAGSEGSTMGGTLTGTQQSVQKFGSTTQVLPDQEVSSQEEADQAAQSQLNQIALDYLSVDGSCSGYPKLRPGTVIELTGIGSRFSGLYYVNRADHKLSQSAGYTTSFSLNRNAV